MHKTSFRAAKRAGVAAAFLMISCGLALAHPGGGPHGGGFHGGYGGGAHGGFGGGFHGGGFNHGGFGAMHNSGFGHHYSSFGHSTFGHSNGAFQHSSGMSRTAMHHSGSVSHHAARGSSHHTHLANSGTPAGFSHGNASWKQNGGTPPGWSHGNKTGWGCKPGSSGCMPPGLAKKQGNGIETASHRPTTSSSRMTPVSYTRRPTSAYSHPTPSRRYVTAAFRIRLRSCTTTARRNSGWLIGCVAADLSIATQPAKRRARRRRRVFCIAGFGTRHRRPALAFAFAASSSN